MKSPLKPLLGVLRSTTREAIEAYAETLLAPDVVRAAALRAAADGRSQCVIRCEKPCNVRGTEAAEKLEAWLKELGLAFEWNRQTVIAKEMFESFETWHLIVRWDGEQGGWQASG